MEEKRTKKYGLGLAPSACRERFVTLLRSFLCICGLAQAYIRAKFSQSYKERWLMISRWPTRPLSPQTLAPALFRWLPCWLPCSVLFCWLVSSVLPGTFLPLSSRGLVGNLVCTPFVWVSRQNQQRDPLIGTHQHPHPHNECLTSCHI